MDAQKFQQAVALHQRGQLAQAEALYRDILKLAPDHFDALHLLGVIEAQRGNYGAAAPLIAQALTLNPGSALAHANMGAVLRDLGRLEDALASCDRALTLDSGHVAASINRGTTLLGLKRPAEALASFDRALATAPDHVEALNNRASVLRGLNRLEEALASLDRALALQPDYADGWTNRGILLRDLNRMEAAITSFERAVALRPDYAEAHWNLSLALLSTGDLSRGWAEYEWRWERAAWKGVKRHFAAPLWRGDQDIAGKAVLLHAEQGVGDTIQFCRYAKMVADRGGRAILEAQPELKSLLAGLGEADQVIGAGDALPEFDFHCPLLSLPLAFRTTLDTIPPGDAYLRAPAGKLDEWNARVGARRTPRIGVAWAGNPEHANDRNRSIELTRILRLLDHDIDVYSLQKDLRAGERELLAAQSGIRHFGDQLRDFSDTAALIALMDVVVTVDTAAAHLAAALGKPTWVLLPYAPDWRWLLDRADSLWYPAIRLFRQPKPGDWDSVIARVGQDLAGYKSQVG